MAPKVYKQIRLLFKRAFRRRLCAIDSASDIVCMPRIHSTPGEPFAAFHAALLDSGFTSASSSITTTRTIEAGSISERALDEDLFADFSDVHSAGWKDLEVSSELSPTLQGNC